MKYEIGEKLKTNCMLETSYGRFPKGTVFTIIHMLKTYKNVYKCLFPDGHILYFASTELDKNCEKLPKTNGDYIRSMTDEQLAEILITTECGDCEKYDCNSCKDKILTWLKEEK